MKIVSREPLDFFYFAELLIVLDHMRIFDVDTIP